MGFYTFESISEYLTAVAEYGVIITGAVICLIPILPWAKMPLNRFLPLVVAVLMAVCFITPWLKLPSGHNGNTFFMPIMLILLLLYMQLVRLEKLKLLYLFLCATASLSFGGLANYVTEARLHPSGPETDLSQWGLVVQWALSIAIMAIFFILRKKTSWTLENFHNMATWALISIVPLGITACNIIMIPRSYAIMSHGKIFEVYLMMESVLVVLFFLLQILFQRIARVSMEKYEVEKKAQLLQTQAYQYLALKNYMEQTDRLRHDFRQTIRTVGQLAREDKYHELKDYLLEYDQALNIKAAPHYFCSHGALNALLGYYADLCENQGIKISWKIALPKQLPLPDVELCSIFGNLLENAIQANEFVNNRKPYINLAADIDHDKSLYITMTNSFDGNVRKWNGRFLSTKKDGNGMGLVSVAATAEKYCGTTRFGYVKEEFQSAVMLKL